MIRILWGCDGSIFPLSQDFLGQDFPDHKLRLMVHTKEHPPQVFSNHSQEEHDQTTEETDGHHHGRPAYGHGGVQQLSDDDENCAKNTEQRKEVAAVGGYPQRHHGIAHDIGVELHQFLKGVAGLPHLPLKMFDRYTADIPAGS